MFPISISSRTKILQVYECCISSAGAKIGSSLSQSECNLPAYTRIGEMDSIVEDVDVGMDLPTTGYHHDDVPGQTILRN